MHLREQGRRVSFVPAQTFVEDRLPLRHLETQRVGKIAVRGGIAGIELDCLAKTLDRGVDLSTVLEHAAEIVVQCRDAGAESQTAAQSLLGLIEPSQRPE